MADTLSSSHNHIFLGEGHERNERRTWMVIALCARAIRAHGLDSNVVGGESAARKR